jgi:hypothetical protein
MFLGHKIASDPKSIQERQASNKGYIVSDLPLLNDLGILKNKKIKAQANEIRDFIHWLGGNRNVPLPPLARRILCLKRALITQSILSVDTPTEQRTRQQKQISEIDELLTRDGLDSESIANEDKCITTSSTFVAPPPTSAPLPPEPVPAIKSSASTVVGAINKTGECPPPVIQCICGGDKNTPAKIMELQSQIKSLELLVLEIQKHTPLTPNSSIKNQDEILINKQPDERDKLINDLLLRIQTLIESVDNSANKNALRKFTSEVIERLEKLYKILLEKKKAYKNLLEIINGLNISSFTKEDFEAYLNTEQNWIEEFIKILRTFNEDEIKINEIISIFTMSEDAKKEIIEKNTYIEFFNTRKEILEGLIKVIFEQLLVIKEKSCDESVVAERKKCEDNLDKIRNEYEARIHTLEEELKKCKESSAKPPVLEQISPTIKPMNNANQVRRNSDVTAVITPLEAQAAPAPAVGEPMQPELQPMNNANANQVRRNSDASAVITPLEAQAAPAAAVGEPIQTELQPMNNANANQVRRNSGSSAVITPLEAQAAPAGDVGEPIQPELQPMNNANANQVRRNSDTSTVITPLEAQAAPAAAVGGPIQPELQPMNNTKEFERIVTYPPTSVITTKYEQPKPRDIFGKPVQSNTKEVEESPQNTWNEGNLLAEPMPKPPQPFYPAGPGPHSVKPSPPEPRIRPRTTRSFVDDMKSSQQVKSQVLDALKGLFTKASKDKIILKKELEEMLLYLTNYYFTTTTPEENPNTVQKINTLLRDERYHNILLNPTGDEIINISMDAALLRKVSPKNITSWDETQALIQPEDSEQVKLQKHNYTKIMVKKILLYLINESPRLRGGRITRRKNKKSQRITRRRQ